jgi:small nuclear ribonucleoprotein D3
MSAGLGVPVKLLHESLGHVVTVELKTGQLYRGKLAEGRSSLISPMVHTDNIFIDSGG